MAGRETQTREIVLKIKGDGARQARAITRELGNVTRQVSTLQGVASKLNSIFNFAVLGVGIGQLTGAADSINLLRDRINALSGGVEEGSRVFEGLQQVAARTKTSVESLSTIYARLGASTKELGLNTSQLLDLTAALQNSFRISGATTGEATSAAIQLSQGLASGQLRGQELRSVLEANVVVGQLLAKTFGVTRAELFKLAEQGLLGASKVTQALLENQEDLQAQADKLNITYGQVLTQAFDRFKVILADISLAVDGPGKLQRGLKLLTDNIEALGIALLTLAGIFVTLKIPAFLSKVVALASAFKAFLLALNPIVLAIAGLVAAFGALSISLGGVREGFKFLVDSLATGLISVINQFKIFAQAAVFTFDKLFGSDLLRQVDVFFDKIGARIREGAAAIAGIPQEVVAKGSTIDILGRLRGNRSGELNLPADKRELERFEAINNQFKKDKDLDKYAIALRRIKEELLETDFNKGTKDLFAYREEARKLKEVDFTQRFRANRISLDQFNGSIRQLRIEDLEDRLRTAKIGAAEFNEELKKINDQFGGGDNFFQKGVDDYIKSIGTLTEQLSSLVKNSFTSLEEALFQFTKTGKLNFKDFAQSVLDDLTKILIRTLVVQNIARGLSSASPALFGTGSATNEAGSGLIPGAVSAKISPTNPTLTTASVSGLSGTSVGLSKTQSTITPQSNMTVNVINNADAAIEQRESVDESGNRTLDVIIYSKMREGLSKGMFDRDFNQAFGLRRRGV